jgi:hypothetical protein
VRVNLDSNVVPEDNMQHWLDDPHFDQIHLAAVGALVMFTENVSLAKGAVNGATATVKGINVDSTQKVTSIAVEVKNTSKHMLLKRTTFQHMYTFGKSSTKVDFQLCLHTL